MRLAILGLSLILTGIMFQLVVDGQIAPLAFTFLAAGKVGVWLGLWDDWKRSRDND